MLDSVREDSSLHEIASVRAPPRRERTRPGASDSAVPPARAAAARALRMGPLLQRQGLYAVVGIVLFTLWGLILWFALKQNQRLIDDSTRELVQVNSAVAQHTAGLFKAIETDLRTLDLWLQAQPHIDPLTDPHFTALVDEMRRGSGGLIDLRAVSAGGQLYDLPSPDRKPRAEVSDSEYDRAQPTPGASGLHIGDPVPSRVTGKWSVPVWWRLASPVGGIRVLVAAVELDQLVGMHERLRLNPQGTIMLVRLDGTVLSRTPFEARDNGRDAKASPFFRSEYLTKRRGSFISSGAFTDGVPRIVSYERLDDAPVTVLVTRGLAEIYETYDQRRRVVLVIAAALSVLLLGFTVVLRRSLRALHGAKRELKRQATTDELTGAKNRRALFSAAKREFERARRFERPMTVLMLDIDHFKRLNDSRGHAAGDRVLSDCAALWQSLLRDQDLLGRVGGEEFCIVLVESGPEAAAQVAERLRAATAEHQFAVNADGDALMLSVSIGSACVDAADSTWSEALARADRALYEAKAEGRNRVRARHA